MLLMMLEIRYPTLVKKTDYDTKISDIEPKYFTISNYNEFTGEILNTKINDIELVCKSDISAVRDDSNLDKEIATLAIKTELKGEKDKLTTSQVFDLSYFRGKSHLEDDRTQNY